MKKFASLLLTVVLLATMLCVFAVPASAARGTDYIGKWVKIEASSFVDGKVDCKYYFYVISKDDLLRMYSVVRYSVDAGGTIFNKTMFNVDYKQIGDTVNSANIPQAVRDRAAQDYPNLAPSGFTVSSGTWWIIAAGAVVIVGGVVAIIVANKKKKKTAVADGAEITDDTEKPEE